MTPSAPTTVTLQITGMSCSSCQHHVTEALEGVPGVGAVEVSLESSEATVALTDPSIATDALVAAVEEAGYGAAPASKGPAGS